MWKTDLETRYYPMAAKVREHKLEGERAAGTGFMNLFPAPGSRAGELYYVSNRGHDYVDLDLIRRGEGGEEKRIVSDVSSRFGVSPDGKQFCFSRRTRANDRGYLRNDLYLYPLETRKEKRLTKGLRATNPSWSPDGGRIACVVTEDAVERIAIVDAATGKHIFVTPRVADREYTGLSWGRDGILAARFEGSSRDIVLVNPETGVETPIVASAADERDPCWNEDGIGFFYASDRTGIFNIYYHGTDGSADLMVTDCVGGEFNPAPAENGLVYSGYGAGGFEIRRLAGWREGAVGIDASRDDAGLLGARARISSGPVVGDEVVSSVSPGSADTVLAAAGGTRVEKRFGIEYTKLFVYPRLMIFQGKPRIGLFLDSGDYLGRQNVFAGGSIAANGEFDLNLAVETRQFKPTFGFEVYRSRTRYAYQAQLEDGTNIEYKLRYDLWDAYFTASMELRPTTQFSREEAVVQYNHGEYGVNVEIWELLREKEFRGEIGWPYYVADEISFLFHYRGIRREIDADINPRAGRSIDLEVTKAYDKLHSGDFAEGLFRPIYNKDYFGRYQLAYAEYVGLPLWRHALGLELKAAAIDKSTINDFFYLYLGGRDGLRGYSYYSMGGTRLGLARLTYRFPVWRNINRQFFGVYLGSLYAGAFAEAGKVWTEDELDLKGNKKDVGFDVRLKGFTFHSYPVAASFEAAYGLDDVVYRDPFDTFAVFYEGRDWKYYGSVLFSF